MLSEERIFADSRWISTSDKVPGKPIGIPAPSLRARKRFYVGKMPSESKAYISGLGAFVLYINGVRVGDEFMSPAFTNYSKTVLYCEYDVTELLSLGENLVCVEVGAGFFNQSTYDGWSFCHAPWRDFEKLLFALFSDGEELLVSDRSWRVTREGPRTNTQIRLGESYDKRLEDGWLKIDFDDSSWQSASLTRIPGGVMKKQILPPMRICEKIDYLSTIVCKNGIIYDFGRNISGNVRIKARGKRGSVLTVKYGERIHEGELDMSIYTYGIKSEDRDELPYGDRYTFGGEGIEEWCAEFVYYGFRYVCISGCEQIISVEANFIHTDLAEKGGFSSSDEVYNWLVSAGVCSFLSNFHGFSEDCPHREKNGWTGDAAISAPHAVYRFEMKEAYKKWLSDIIDCQLGSGQLPAIAPTAIYGYTWGSGPAWDHALFSIPEVYYKESGDDSLFDGIIEPGIRYFSYAEMYEDGDSLVHFGLSDWCAPLSVTEEEMGDVLEGFDTAGRTRMTVASGRFSDSCYHYKNLLIFAEALSRRADSSAREYFAHAERVLSGIRRVYLHGGTVDNDTQSALALALYFGIAVGSEADALMKRLKEKIISAEYKMECGILGTKALFSVLAERGECELIDRMLRIEDYPSYGFWRRLGLKTFPELWEVAEGSRNHHMYSDIVNYCYHFIGGIRNTGVGYDSCLISPYIFSDSCSASAYTETARGRISLSWSYEDGAFTAECEIPEGCCAAISVLGEEMPLKCGKNKILIRKGRE